MLALGNPIKTRLQALPQLTGWQVRLCTELTDRRQVPAADVRMVGASMPSNRSTAATVAPQWVVTLIVRRSDTAADELDAAFTAVIASLHNWLPGQHGGRGWEPLRAVGSAEAPFSDEGVAAFEINFSTQALYAGQP